MVLAVLVLAAAAASADAPQEFSVSIRDGAVPAAQRVLKVSQQATVRIAWSADRATTVHLEGYDLSVLVQPGTPHIMEFRAFAAGRFAVHAHEGARSGPGASHAHGRGALLRLEVHPR
jgi:hypothetical protein